MPYGNIIDVSINNHKQLHHSSGLSDTKTVIAYYNLALLQMCKVLWFGIAGPGCTKQLKSVTVLQYELFKLFNLFIKLPSYSHHSFSISSISFFTFDVYVYIYIYIYIYSYTSNEALGICPSKYKVLLQITKMLYIFHFWAGKLQARTKYLTKTLVFVWNSALPGKLNFYFQRAFC